MSSSASRTATAAPLSDCESDTKLANRLFGLSGEIANFLPRSSYTCHLEQGGLSKGCVLLSKAENVRKVKVAPADWRPQVYISSFARMWRELHTPLGRSWRVAQERVKNLDTNGILNAALLLSEF